MTRYFRELAVFVAFALLAVIMFIARPDVFWAEFRNTWLSASPTLVVAVGMTLIIISRQIDISVGSQLSVCAVLAAVFAKAGLPMPVVTLAAISCGAAIGAFNGLFVALFRLPSIVVTLATMVISREALSWARQGASVQGLPPGFQWLGLPQAGGEMVLMVTAAIVLGVAVWATRSLAAGRAPYAVGSDLEAARLAGVRPKQVVFWVFVLTGALAGLAGTLEAIRQPIVATNLGKDLELKVIAAVVVGGTAITGGRGRMLGTLAGVALLSIIGPALSSLNVPQEWEKAVYGSIILLAVGSEVLLRRDKNPNAQRLAAA
ncbi:ABC transporter permease [Humisphaera borealis]|uniref:Autoinducer 2 import system permease protein LsrC n=1 Tax=Humisphaera borealis TaxID=2807512 RepID=A0A7M2WRL4_9BACT|nr:ABC transporter permease [Humisphaera borealis]QOV88167.1 ABC transporter permease [Humisphaera borealis]